MPSQVTLSGGPFTDAQGTPLASGYLTFELNQDEQIAGTAQIAAGKIVQINLDASGNIASAQTVWGNDQMTPSNSYYIVKGYTQAGQLAWGPNYQQVTGASPFNVSTWVPNQLTTWNPPLQVPTLQTNEVNNGSQGLLDLHAGTNITLSDNGSGRITISSSAGSLTLQTNEVNNGSQSLLDLHAGSNITLTDNGSGRVTVAAAGGGISPAQTPRTGDALTYNLYGDNAWDSGMWLRRFFYAFAENGGGNAASAPASIGANTTLLNVFGGPTLANVTSTATEGYLLRSTSTSTAATTNNNGYVGFQGNVGQGHWPLGTFNRFAARMRFETTTNVRWWVGMFEGAQITLLPTDTPNMNYAGFRFSAGTDTSFQAVCGQSNVLQTVVSTGVAVDTTNSQFFEISRDASNFYFYINGSLVATISTNLPSATSQCALVVAGDNKNTANSNAYCFGWMGLTFK